MDNENLIKKISFFSSQAKYTKITDTASGAIIRKVEDNNKTYLLKIIKSDCIDIDNFVNIVKTYKNANINSIELIDYGIIENYTYIIYKYIEGTPLNKLYTTFNEENFYNWGKDIGQKYHFLNQQKHQNIKVREYNIIDLTAKTTSQFLKIYNSSLSYLQTVFSKEEILKITERLKELTNAFEFEKRVLIHSDMHPKNIILNDKNELYIIDVDATSYDYFVMNFRYSLMAAYKHPQNKEFFKGFINGCYNNKIPVSFNLQLTYTLILNFMEHIILFENTKTKEYILDYTSSVKKIFTDINIFNNTNILN